MDSMERVPIGGIDVQYALMAFGICVYEKKRNERASVQCSGMARILRISLLCKCSSPF